MSFGAAADLGHHARSQLEGGAQAIILDFERVPFLDVSAALAIETVARDAKQSDRTIYLCCMNKSVEQTLSALQADKHINPADHLPTLEDALEAALNQLRK
jgi:SulP family sulfate permease